MVAVKALKNVQLKHDLAAFSPSLERDGGVYVSALEHPLIIQTPTLTLTTDLLENDDVVSFTNLRLKTSTLAFFKEVEEELIQQAIAHKGTWFREDIDDETIAQSFKSFVTDEDRLLRVRVADTCTAYDSEKTKVPLPPAGTKVKAVLELSRLTFSKTQFGAVWNLKQVRLAEEPKYLFEEECVEGIAEEINDSILAVDDEAEVAADIA